MSATCASASRLAHPAAPACRFPPPARLAGQRSGAILVLTALLLVVLCAFVSFGLDVGYMLLVRTQLQRAADAASMAATDELRQTGSTTSARKAAYEIAHLNQAAGLPVSIDPEADLVFGRRVYNAAKNTWQFRPNEQPYDSVQARARRTKDSTDGSVRLFFAQAIGIDHFDSLASATATYLPRDIALAIDLSGSMHYDSSIMREPERGRGAIDDSLKAIWLHLGSPKVGNLSNWNNLVSISGTDLTTIKTALQLDTTPYPYPVGNWNEYIDFVSGRSGSSAYRGHIVDRGYRYKYGPKTFVDYLQWIHSKYTDTPALASSPEQPITALKDAVEIMTDYLASLNTEEWVALCTYDDNSRTEIPLTSDLSSISTRMRQIGAGHYSRQTNIGGGIKQALAALTGPNARLQARKVMVVMTDGEANRPSGNETSDKNYALQQAKYAADQGITIYTVTVGALADKALMDEIAQIGSGFHYHVEGYDVAQYTADLQRVFVNISSNRPLVLTE